MSAEQRKQIADRYQEMRQLAARLEAFFHEARDISAVYETALRQPIERAFDTTNEQPERVARLFNNIHDLSNALTGGK